MDIDKELEEVMDVQREWQGSPDQMWQRVEREIRRRQVRRQWSVPVWAAGAVAAAVIGLFIVQAHRGPVQSVPPIAAVPDPSPTRAPHSGQRAEIYRTMGGIVDEIQGGYLMLRDVTYSPNVADPKPEPRVPVPEGRWITQTHWQSDDGSLDLFRGQPVDYFLDDRTFMPGIQPSHGIVQNVNGNTIAIDVYDGDYGTPLSWHSVGVQTFRLSPHSQRGDHGDRQERTVRPGDKLVVLWYGEPSDQVVWQYTFLP